MREVIYLDGMLLWEIGRDGCKGKMLASMDYHRIRAVLKETATHV